MLTKKLIKLQLESQFLAQSSILSFYRHGHVIRGKRPGVARSLEQRLKEENISDPELTKKIDIGFPHLMSSRSQQLKLRLEHLKQQRADKNLEKLAKQKTLSINLDLVKQDWLSGNGPYHIRKIAEHFGVYEHLFGDAYFNPRVALNVQYEISDEDLLPVYWGNTIHPSDAKHAPIVTFDHKTNLYDHNTDNTLWTLIMTNPDGHLVERNKEYIHWLISNIPNGDVTKGDLIVPYLQPFPPKGTGYHRHIFVLYKQIKRLDYSAYRTGKPNDLNSRTFSTLDFYRKHQDDITPAGLVFFQSIWDKSLTDFYHNTLEMKEPHYEYDFPKPYIKNQKWFPLKQPFNVYMDKYRDPKQINKEYLEKKLAKTHPFNGPEPALRFPNAYSLKGVPSWLRVQLMKDRLGWGRINDIK